MTNVETSVNHGGLVYFFIYIKLPWFVSGLTKNLKCGACIMLPKIFAHALKKKTRLAIISKNIQKI